MISFKKWLEINEANWFSRLFQGWNNLELLRKQLIKQGLSPEEIEQILKDTENPDEFNRKRNEKEQQKLSQTQNWLQTGLSTEEINNKAIFYARYLKIMSGNTKSDKEVIGAALRKYNRADINVIQDALAQGFKSGQEEAQFRQQVAIAAKQGYN